MNIDEVFEKAREYETPEEQGYFLAPYMAKHTSNTPEELLVRLLRVSRINDTLVDIGRDIGVIRWCLDQRIIAGRLN